MVRSPLRRLRCGCSDSGEGGSPEHFVPRPLGGSDAWENLVSSAKEVHQLKAGRLPHEAGPKLRSIPRAPRGVPLSALTRNGHGIDDWELFV